MESLLLTKPRITGIRGYAELRYRFSHRRYLPPCRRKKRGQIVPGKRLRERGEKETGRGRIVVLVEPPGTEEIRERRIHDNYSNSTNRSAGAITLRCELAFTCGRCVREEAGLGRGGDTARKLNEEEKDDEGEAREDGEERRRLGTRKRRGDVRETRRREERVRDVSLCKASRFRRCVLRTDRLSKHGRTTKAGHVKSTVIPLLAGFKCNKGRSE